MTNSDIIKRISNHCATEGISESTFGLRAVNDGKLVERLRNGKTITLATLERINQALAGREVSQ